MVPPHDIINPQDNVSSSMDEVLTFSEYLETTSYNLLSESEHRALLLRKDFHSYDGRLPELSEAQKEILAGLLLGDAHLSQSSTGHWRLMLEQSNITHQAYLVHLYSIFGDWSRQGPKIRARGKTENVGFRTLCHKDFDDFGRYFYKDGKKIIPANIGQYLTPRACAYWYQDDGALKGKGRFGKRLHTECFLLPEVEILRDALVAMGVETTINRQNRTYKGIARCQYVLNITSAGDKVFTRMIAPYVHESMFYKLYAFEDVTRYSS